MRFGLEGQWQAVLLLRRFWSEDGVTPCVTPSPPEISVRLAKLARWPGSKCV
jgi:hypothetical protein